MSDETIPRDLVPIAEAPKYLKSNRPGKKVALQTLYRWCLTGKLRCWKRGPWRFVSRADLRRMMKRETVAEQEPTRTEQRKLSKGHLEAMERLRAAGMAD